jgi:hypothetical protein
VSRGRARSTRLRRRPSRTIPALVVGILLLATGTASVWLAVSRLAQGTWSTLLQGPRDWLASLRWDSPSLWGIGAAAAAVGLVLLLCAIIPGGFTALSVRGPGDAAPGDGGPPPLERETVMTRRAVAHLARAQCEQVDGVASASATATATRVHLRVRTSLRDTADLRGQVTDRVRRRLEETGLDPAPRVTATVESRG